MVDVTDLKEDNLTVRRYLSLPGSRVVLACCEVASRLWSCSLGRRVHAPWVGRRDRRVDGVGGHGGSLVETSCGSGLIRGSPLGRR